MSICDEIVANKYLNILLYQQKYGTCKAVKFLFKQESPLTFLNSVIMMLKKNHLIQIAYIKKHRHFFNDVSFSAAKN